MGRLVEKKGFNYLVDACGLLRSRGRKLRCRIIGAGESEAALRAQVADLGLEETIDLVGPMSREPVLEEIGRARLLALPCVVAEDGNRDALPTVLLEAMAAGRPVVSTDLEGVTEIVVHGRTGLLAPQHDAPALAEAIDRLLADSDFAARLRHAGRERAESLFDRRRNVQALVSLFRRATEAPEECSLELAAEAVS